jgi:hypothetical protein
MATISSSTSRCDSSHRGRSRKRAFATAQGYERFRRVGQSRGVMNGQSCLAGAVGCG